jgi:hypothetical protein
MSELIKNEKGMTIVELAVVSALMLFVVGISYSAIQLVTSADNFAESQAAYVNDVSYPLAHLSDLIMQNSAIDTAPTPNRISFKTDKNMDGTLERNILTVTSHGLTIDRYQIDDTGANTTHTASYKLSPDNTNLLHNQNLLEYYGKNGGQITNMGDVPGQTWSIVLTIYADYRGRTMHGSQTIHFRNRAGG